MALQRPERWDEVVDVVVVGTGGAAMSAALTAADGGAQVLVIEKDDVVGGTTGVSGGVMWIPNNHRMPELGMTDSVPDVIAYIERNADGRGDSELIALYPVVDLKQLPATAKVIEIPLTPELNWLVIYLTPNEKVDAAIQANDWRVVPIERVCDHDDENILTKAAGTATC